MNIKCVKKFLLVGLMFILIISSVNSIMVGNYKQENFEEEFFGEDFNDLYIDFKSEYYDYCYDSKDKFDYYVDELLKDYGESGEQSGLFYINDEVKPPQNLLTYNGPMNSSWPMKSHDNRHTGLSPYETSHVDGTEKWRFYTRSVDGGVIIDDDGIIYVPGGYSTIYAVYPDGTLKWSYDAEGLLWSTPAIAEDGTIYQGTYDYYLYAINSDGTLKWRYDANASISSSPAIADDGTIYFGTMWTGGRGGKIYAINPDGTEKWHYQTGNFIESDPAIGNDDTIYIGSGDNYLYAMNPNGTLKWRFKTGDEIHNHPSIAEDGTIYICSFDDYVYAVNPDGTEKWRYDIDRGSSTGMAIADDGTIYIGYEDFYAINTDGTLKWIFNLDGYFVGKSAPALSDDGTIYVGITSGTPSWPESGFIIAINPDGTEKWRKMIAEESSVVESPPAIAEDGTVYICSNRKSASGYLHAFSNYHDLKISELRGGFGKVNALVTNNLDHTIEDIDVAFTVQGGILDLIDFESHVIIDSLDSGESRTIRSKGRILGLGPVDINVKAICDEVGEVSLYEPGMVLLFLVLKTDL